MIICSALYYSGSLARGDLIVRDNRHYPGKYVETFPVWWSYICCHYPTEQIILFADRNSPIPIRPLLKAHLDEPWSDEDPYRTLPEIDVSTSDEDRQRRDTLKGLREAGARVRVIWLDAFAGQYFRPMQRNLVEGIIAAYSLNEDLLWIDNDAFCNTRLTPLVAGYDAAAPELAAHQMTMDSVCTYISAARLHALDSLGIDLPAFLTTMLAHGPTETRMHTLQEGGLYKLFGYGKTRALAGSIELSHLSCYDHFMAFLRRNPLDTDAYRLLLDKLPPMAERARAGGAEMAFHDMDYSIKGAV